MEIFVSWLERGCRGKVELITFYWWRFRCRLTAPRWPVNTFHQIEVNRLMKRRIGGAARAVVSLSRNQLVRRSRNLVVNFTEMSNWTVR